MDLISQVSKLIDVEDYLDDYEQIGKYKESINEHISKILSDTSINRHWFVSKKASFGMNCIKNIIEISVLQNKIKEVIYDMNYLDTEIYEFNIPLHELIIETYLDDLKIKYVKNMDFEIVPGTRGYWFIYKNQQHYFITETKYEDRISYLCHKMNIKYVVLHDNDNILDRINFLLKKGDNVMKIDDRNKIKIDKIFEWNKKIYKSTNN